MADAHTPGPWAVRAYKNETGGIWVDCNAFANKGKGRCLGGTICDVYDSGATQEANARLIAAAPETAAERDRLKAVNAELLEALNRLCEMYSPISGPDAVKQTPLWAYARAAIAKATGQDGAA